MSELEVIACLIAERFNAGNKLLLMGNGGSMATACHIAAEFTVRLKKDRRALPAIALGANAAAYSACSNDFGHDKVFCREIEALGREGDVILALTTSGRSKNILEGLEAARIARITTISWTGSEHGQTIVGLSDHIQAVSGGGFLTTFVQECHMSWGHDLVELIEEEMRL